MWRYIVGLLLLTVCFTGKCEIKPPKDKTLAYKNAIRMYYLYKAQVITINYQDSVIQNQNKIIAIDSNIISNMSLQIAQFNTIIEKHVAYENNLIVTIKNQKKEIRRQKIEKWVGVGSGTAIIGVLLFLLLK